MADLSSDAREAAKTRSIQGAWGLKQLLKLLAELATLDVALEAQAKAKKGRMILFIVLAAFSIFLGSMYAPLFAVTLALIVLAIHTGRQWRALAQMDMIDDFRLSFAPALRDLAHDLAPGEKIKVAMDLSGTSPLKQKSKLELPHGRFQKVMETVFVDPWCEARLPLLDGSTAVLAFENTSTRLERRYKTSRGKTKWKTKWKKECSVTATLIPGSPCSWNQSKLEARLDPVWEKLKYTEKGGVRCARLERTWAFKGASGVPRDTPGAKFIVGMLLRLHGAMEAAK